MKIPENIVQGMITHAHKESPRECVGIIAGRDGEAVKLYKARNASSDQHQYVVHPTDLKRIHKDLEERDLDIFATYHSHPRTEAYPSGDDVELAVGGSCPYIIVSIEDPDLAVVRAFTIVSGRDSGAVIEIPVEKN